MKRAPTVWFFTDFGTEGPYLALMESALLAHCPGARVVNLMADAPAFAPRPAARLLAALLPWLPEDALVVGVVDPGVGGRRRPLLLEVDGRRFIGPDNGLFAGPINGGREVRAWEIDIGGFRLSASFHGRDLFAPAAGRLLAGEQLGVKETAVEGLEGHGWPAELAEVIYIDHYGNAMTGLDAPSEAAPRFRVGGHLVERAGTFSEVPEGTPFWYVNSLGLVEIAVNRGRADRLLGLEVGTPVIRA